MSTDNDITSAADTSAADTSAAGKTSAADPSAAIRRAYKGVNGILLPTHIVGYIASICKATYEAPLLLNLYKAFESINCEGDEDPLDDYKNMIQNYILILADEYNFNRTTSGVNHELEHLLTKRERMNVFDVVHCYPSDIMYGLEPTISHRAWIDDEIANCTKLIRSFGLGGGLRFGVCEAIDKMLYKHTRLLEEALRTQSPGLMRYMFHSGWIYPDMISYIYIKHNHIRYAPKEDILSNNPLWLHLLREFNLLDVVLGVAISGVCEEDKFGYATFTNVVRPNLATVKKIVPQYIDAGSIMMYPYATEDELNAYEYWQATFNQEIYTLLGENNYKKHIVEGNREIGEYLLSFFK